MNYKTCTHTYDSGRACKSAAATGREYCGYHLHYRGRQMRMARAPASISVPTNRKSALSCVVGSADLILPQGAGFH